MIPFFSISFVFFVERADPFFSLLNSGSHTHCLPPAETPPGGLFDCDSCLSP